MLAWGQLPKPPKITPPKAPDVGKIVDKVVSTVDSATVSAGNAAGDTFQKAGKAVSVVGETVTTASVRKLVAGTTDTYEMVVGGKPAGRFVIKDNKIVKSATIKADGTFNPMVDAAGGKFLVDAQRKITGREILVDGKVVGTELIDAAGKVSGNTVSDTAHFVLDKHKDIVYIGLSKNVCEAVVKSVRTGTKVELPAIPGLPGLPKIEEILNSAPVTKAVAKAKTLTNDGLWKLVRKKYEGSDTQVAEIKALVSDSNGKKLKEVFSDASICSGSIADLDNRLDKLGLRPAFAGRKKTSSLEDFFVRPVQAASTQEKFYMTYNIAVGGGAGVGASLTLSAVTDYAGHGGLYVALGPQLISNMGGGVAFTMGFFPNVSEESFEGWGWALGASFPAPVAALAKNKLLGIGFEVNLSETMQDTQGFGFIVGAGFSKLPADMSLGGGWTWKVSK
jgi:hypothetical protein